VSLLEGAASLVVGAGFVASIVLWGSDGCVLDEGRLMKQGRGDGVAREERLANVVWLVG